MKTASYKFRWLSLAFWIIVFVGAKLLGVGLSWFGCIFLLIILWLFTIVARVSGIQAVPKVLKMIVDDFVKQLPFFLSALALSFALIIVGNNHSSRILVISGSIILFATIWIINWPRVDWYAPITRWVRKTRK